jgi:lysophospholipase L1-like esterase
MFSRSLCLSMLLFSSAIAAPPQPEDPKLRPVTPTPGHFPDHPDAWMNIHRAMLEMTKANQGPCDILLIGDSITYGWGNSWDKNPARQEWQAAFGKVRMLNFGIGGDKTQNVLWRLQNGEGDGIQPRVVLLAIGVNNVWDWSVPAPAVAQGVKACVEELRKKFPAAKILVVPPIPQQEMPDAPNRKRTDEIRGEIVKLKLGAMPAVSVLVIEGQFLGPDGRIDKAIMPDLLHPNGAGYRIYAEALKPEIEKLLK